MTSGRLRTIIPAETAELIQRLRAAKQSWNAIERQVGFTADVMRRHFGYVKPGGTRKATVGRSHVYGIEFDYVKPDPRVLASVPRDTRTMTARVFGDPLPGRSALDRRRPG